MGHATSVGGRALAIARSVYAPSAKSPDGPLPGPNSALVPSLTPRLRWMLPGALGVALVTGTFSWFAARLLLGPPLRPGPASTYRWFLFSTVAFWVSWSLCAPIVLRVANRFRFVPGHRRTAAAVHVAAGFGVICGQSLLADLMRLTAAPLFGVPIQNTYRFMTAGLLQNLDWNYSVYLGIVGVSHALFFQQQSRARALAASQLEARLAEAQLQALQRQLHPHFLFNTLHAIFTLVRLDPRAAELMIERLSELLRVTLRNTATQEVPLADELAYLDRYLAIEKVHFGDRLEVIVDVPLGIRDAAVPYLILQPLVENAVRHGLAPQRSRGTVAIVGRREGDELILSVSDTGRGVSGGHLVVLNEGVGLTNTRARLERLYGPGQRLSFEAPPAGGLIVTMRLPCRPLPCTQPAVAEAIA